jgi:hypothetical protein
LPVWQDMYESVKDHDFIVIAVAQESRGEETAREFIEAADPSYVCLIDEQHQVADLYNMVNVPNAVWIDENGVIVRPSETAGSHDSFRSMNRTDFSQSDEALALAAKAQSTYLAAVKDWAIKGSESEHAFSEQEAREHIARPTQQTALAHASFQLGIYLRKNGKEEEGDLFLKSASELHPDSWNMFRQAMNLKDIGEVAGLAADQSFFDRLDALEGKRYYPPPDIAGFPREPGY